MAEDFAFLRRLAKTHPADWTLGRLAAHVKADPRHAAEYRAALDAMTETDTPAVAPEAEAAPADTSEEQIANV